MKGHKKQTRSKPTTAPKPLARKNPRVELIANHLPEEQIEKGHIKTAKAAISPALDAWRVIISTDYRQTGALNGVDTPFIMDVLQDQAAALSRGDMSHVEAMLMNQATALQSLFARLTERAMAQDRISNIEGFMRVALRAQNQCRATLETLAAIKNPPVVFAKQANINQGSGNQQVNNGTPAPASHAEKIINQQNELLEVQHGSETVDTRTTGATIGKNPAMASVG